MRLWTLLWQIAVLVLLVGILGGVDRHRLEMSWTVLGVAWAAVAVTWILARRGRVD